MENLIYPLSEIAWMSGIIAIGIVFALFALAWNKGEDGNIN